MPLTRTKKLALNTVFSLINQTVVIICGFILPRMFLTTYGSAVNGLQASITQFLGFIALCELGVGAVVQSALYKPLAQKNKESISQIVCSAESFFHKLGWILAGYTVLLMAFYPLLIKKEFGFIYTASLILIISISAFGRYFLGITYRLLLNADQMGFIQLSLNSLALILNTIVAVFLMKNGADIHWVKLCSSLIFIMQPVCLALYVHKHYRIDHKLKLYTEPIQQKWNGIAQHISAFVLGGTDIAVLTIFSTLDSVSVYTVYNLVVNGIKQFVMALTVGVQATFGNMLAKKEMHNLALAFGHFEWLMHTVTTFLFGLTGLLIVNFVRVYTHGVTDTNYIVPDFAILFTCAMATHCVRLPYNILILATGHFKETQNSAFIEAGINLVLSVVLVFRFGLIGVAIGTLMALLYRTIYFAHYLSHNIIGRHLAHFKKHILVDVLVIICMIIATHPFQMTDVSYLAWFVLACKTGSVCLVVSSIMNWLFYRQEITQLYKRLCQKFLL